MRFIDALFGHDNGVMETPSYSIPGVGGKTRVSEAFGEKYAELALLDDLDAKNLIALAALTSGCSDEQDPISASITKLRTQLQQLETLAKTKNIGTLKLSLQDFIRAGRVYRNYVASFKMLRTHLETLGHHEKDRELKATFVERFADTMAVGSTTKFSELYNAFVSGTLNEDDAHTLATRLNLYKAEDIDMFVKQRNTPKTLEPIGSLKAATPEDIQLLRQLVGTEPVDADFLKSTFQRFNHRVEVNELTCPTFALTTLRVGEMLEEYVYVLSARIRALRQCGLAYETETNSFDDAVLIHASLGLKLPSIFVSFRLEFGFKNELPLVGPCGSVVPLQYPLSQEIWWPFLYVGIQTPEDLQPELAEMETMCKQIASLELREHVESVIARCKRGFKLDEKPSDAEQEVTGDELTFEQTDLLEGGWD